MWIKICGNTNLEDAQLAVSYGANAVGFVFAPSPRRVTAEQASEITRRLPKTVEKYGVFVEADFDEIVTTVNRAGLTGVQLHSHEDRTLPMRLRQHFAPLGQIAIVQVLHYGEHLDSQVLLLPSAIDAVLVDSQTANAKGGTGIAYDWQEARSSFFRAAPLLRMIAAGGLKPDNVAEAIDTLQPWGVDVCSGVEAAPGRKDPNLVSEFIEQVRSAGAQIKQGNQAAPVRA